MQEVGRRELGYFFFFIFKIDGGILGTKLLNLITVVISRSGASEGFR